MAVTRTEQHAGRILEQFLTEIPGRDNMYEDCPYFPSDGARTIGDCPGEVVHLVVADEEDVPVVSAVFGSLDAATTHAEELRQPGQLEVSVVDLVMETDARPR